MIIDFKIFEQQYEANPYGEEVWDNFEDDEIVVIKHQRIGENEDFGWDYFIAKDNEPHYYKICTGDKFNRELLVNKWDINDEFRDDRDKYELVNSKKDAKHILNCDREYYIATYNKYGKQIQCIKVVPDEVRMPATNFLVKILDR